MDFNLFNNKVLSISLFQKDAIIGIGSKCSNGNHVLHLDLDDKTEIESIKILKFLQKKYDLGTSLLLQSSDNSFHGIFLDKLPFKLMISIQKEINLKHGCISEMKGESTIRLSSKFGSFVKYKLIVYSFNKVYSQSLAHYNAFVNHFKLTEFFTKVKKVMFPMLDISNKFNLYTYEKRLKIW
jgi:hypothetical protein